METNNLVQPFPVNDWQAGSEPWRKCSISEIEDLLQRYYDARTTPQEEELLAQFFIHNDVPPRLAADKALFTALYAPEAGDAPIPEGLQERLSARIDACAEASTPRLALRKTRIWLAGIAAVLLVAVTIGVVALRPQPMQDTYSSPQEAYAETRRALALFASKLDKGMSAVQRVEQAHQSIEQHLNKINYETDMYIFAVDSI